MTNPPSRMDLEAVPPPLDTPPAPYGADLAEVLSGLAAPQKRLPCRYFYDQEGSRLFEEICRLPEYYPTRIETGILRENADEIAELLGPGCLLIEPGSGNGAKARLLLDHLQEPAGYVPIEISRDPLVRAASLLAETYPGLKIVPVCGDFTRLPTLPPRMPARRRVIFFPGSTIGNLEPHQAQSFLRRAARLCGRDGGLLIGVDLKKDRLILERAYNDTRGITAAFNRNLLLNVNRELGAEFRPEKFQHLAFYNEKDGRIEMHLASLEDQAVTVTGIPFTLRRGETICTEHSYKYSPDEFDALARRAGFCRVRIWQDEQRQFSVQYFTVQARPRRSPPRQKPAARPKPRSPARRQVRRRRAAPRQ